MAGSRNWLKFAYSHTIHTGPFRDSCTVALHANQSFSSGKTRRKTLTLV
jgi:hypothetical protein